MPKTPPLYYYGKETTYSTGLKMGKKEIYSGCAAVRLSAGGGEIAGYFGGGVGRQTQQPVSAASCRQARLPVRRINDRGHGRVNLCQHEKSIKLLSPASHSLKQRARLYCESSAPPPKKKEEKNTLSFCLCLSPAKQYKCEEQLFYQTGS